MCVVLACAGISKADIANWYCAPDGDGVFTLNSPIVWVDNTITGEYDMTVDAAHNSWDYGHMIGWFDMDPLDGDPTIKVINSIDNDTGFDWTDYHVNIYMNLPFTLTNAIVYNPNDWSATPGTISATWNGSEYVGSIDYNYGTTVAVGGTLDFGYKLNFVGSPGGHYTYTQEVLPTPEPGTFVLLACGLVGLLVMRRRFA